MLGPVHIRSAPGIDRDNTSLESKAYTDGQWVRFQDGLPRKINGYRSITSTMPQISRGLTVYPTGGLSYIHSGGSSTLNQLNLNADGTFALQTDRTPAALVANANNMWQFAYIWDVGSGTLRIAAHAGQNLADISSLVNSKVWYGDVSAAGLLIDSTSPQVSGGVVALPPYLFSYGSNGNINWTLPNSPGTWTGAGSGNVNITDKKIVSALPYRNGSGGPAGIFWSLDSVIRTEFVGAAAGYFEFDTLTAQSSIMSSQCVIEYDGVFYWMGVDRWMMFNGIVQEVKNTQNSDYVFDNLNYTWRQKVFVFKVPRRGEIWWCYPRGNSTECNAAVIYNLREKCWYDTMLPGSGRSAAFYSQLLNFPIMSDLDVIASQYTLWRHEFGVDAQLGSDVSAIDSYFETSDIAMFKAEQGASLKGMRVARLEPDFVQTGNMTVTVKGRTTATAPYVTGSTHTMYPAPQIIPERQTVPLKDVQRLMRFRFESNVGGGNYWMGHTIAHMEPADERFQT